MDVKCGEGAFMKSRADAKRLAESIVRVARLNGLACEALITAMDAPLGRAVGHASEVIESMETLKGCGPADLTELSVVLAARMVRLAGLANSESEARQRVEAALASGAGVERFRQLVEQQGGDPRVVDDYSRLPAAPHELRIEAERPGVVATLNAQAVGVASLWLGGGRNQVSDRIDAAVGIGILAKVGEAVRAGDPIFRIQYRGDSRLSDVVTLLRSAYTLSEETVPQPPLVWELLI
jgi:thymidine phosphorylase